MSEDERFESYLRNFRPLPPSPPPRRRTRGKVRRFLISALSAAAGVLIAALLGFHFWARHRPSSATSEDRPKANSIPVAGPLTTERANAAIFRNSSVKAGLDQMTFPVRSNRLSAGEVSALEMLGEEKHEY
jgi:hypothetical protein